MSEKTSIRWGIIGLGKIAHKFATDLDTLENATLEGVASRSLEKAAAFASQFGAQQSFGSYEELVLSPTIDVVYIATPHAFHKENTLLCLTHKKAVLCEKPLGISLSEVDTVFDFAKKQNTLLMEALWTHFLPHYTYALAQAKNPALGRLNVLKANFGFKADFDPKSRLFNKALAGGSLLDVGIYPLFAALTFLGMPQQIKATASYSTTGVDESCEMQLKYTDGTIAHLFSSIVENTDTTANMTFENGHIKIHTRFHEPARVSVTINGETTETDFPTEVHGYYFEAAHMQELLSNGLIESPIMSHKKSRQLATLLDSVRKQIGLDYSL